MTVHTLTPRLETIAGLIENAGLVADIGTDHAYLPVSLISRGRAKRALACDIRRGPLERAAATVERYGMGGDVELRLGAGLDPISLNDGVDTIVIAGMGGLVICDILEQGSIVACAAKRIILQPMTKVSEVREYVYEKGFSDIREYLVREDEKLYHILSMSTEPAENLPLSDAERLLGRDIEHNELFDEYRERQIKKLKKTVCGLKRSVLESSGDKTGKENEKKENEIKKAEALLSEIQG